MEKKESLSRRSVRTFAVLIIGRVLSLLIGILSIIMVAKLLGPSDYGVFTLAYAFFTLVSAMSNFGYGVYLTKHLSESEDQGDREGFASVLSTGLLSVIVMGFILTVIGMGLSGYVASLFHAQGVTTMTLMLASSIIFFSMLYGTADYALIGVGKNAAAASLEIFENIVLLVVSVGLIQLGYGSMGAIAGLLISYIVAGALGIYLILDFAHKDMGTKIGWPKMKDLKEAFTFSLPIAINNFLNNGMVSFGTLLLGIYASTYALGNYGIAIRANTLVSVFYTTTATVLITTLTIAYSREKKGADPGKFSIIYNKAMVYSVLISAPLVAYLGVFSKPLIYLFISQNFSSSPLYLSLISLGTILGLVGIFTTSVFIARAKTSKVLKYSIISAFIQFISLIALIPIWGITGAIVALFIIDGLVNDYLFLRGVRRWLNLNTKYAELVRAFESNVALALVLALVLFSFSDFATQLVIGAIVMVIAYPFFLVLFSSIDGDDLHIMREATSHFYLLRPFFNPVIAYFRFLMTHLHGQVVN